MLNATSDRFLVSIAAAVVLAGCDVRGAPQAKHEAPPAWYDGTLPILRFKEDHARERGWVLTTGGVVVVDFKSRQTAAYVPLPRYPGPEATALRARGRRRPGNRGRTPFSTAR